MRTPLRIIGTLLFVCFFFVRVRQRLATVGLVMSVCTPACNSETRTGGGVVKLHVGNF